MRWDMTFLYPGLSMQIAPSANTAGVLEFALDPHREALSQHTLKEANTGNINLDCAFTGATTLSTYLL